MFTRAEYVTAFPLKARSSLTNHSTVPPAIVIGRKVFGLSKGPCRLMLSAKEREKVEALAGRERCSYIYRGAYRRPKRDLQGVRPH